MQQRIEALRILVVEDEYFLARDIAEALTAAETLVIGPVATARQALGALESEMIDGAVLDLQLEGRADFVIADELLRRRVPFVFGTGYGGSVVPGRFSGIRRFEKPYDSAKLARNLLQMLGRETAGSGD